MQKFLQVFETSLYWLLIFLVSFIILFPKFPLLSVSGTFVSIRAEDLFVALSLLVWFIYLVLSGKIREFLKDKLYQALLLFAFVGIVSVFSASFLTHTVLPHLGILHFLRRFEFILLMPFAYTVIKSKKQLITALFLLSGVVLLVNLYALGQQYLDWPVVSTTNSELSKGTILRLTPGARINSTFAGHYDLAIFSVMVLTMLISLLFLPKQIITRIWIASLAGLSFLILVMTAARLSFLAAIVGVIMPLILIGKKALVLIMIALAVLAIAYPSQLRDRLVSTVTINLLGGGIRYVNEDIGLQNQLNIPTLSYERATPSAESTASATSSTKLASDIAPGEPIDTTELGVYRSFEIRTHVEWPRAIRAFEKNPLLGTGYSSLGLAVDNDFLRSLGEVGILGTFAFVLVLIEIFKRIWQEYKSGDKFARYFASGAISLVVAFCLNGLFIDVFESSKVAAVFWILVGMSLALKKLR